MSTAIGTVSTLLDAAKRTDPNGGISTAIAELLTEKNPILDDIMWQEGNLATGHRLTMRTGLPASTWRMLNQGVSATKSTTAQVDEGTAMLEQKGQIDKDLAMLNGNTAEFRLSENIAHIDAMNNDFAFNLFYGDDTTAPEKFLGLTPRYNSLSAVNAQNIISGGSVSGGDATSIWIIGWGARSVMGIYPKGSKAGLQHTPVQDGSGDGCTEVSDPDGGTYRALVDRYQWKCGMALADWRYAVRICNIDVSALIAESGAADIIKLLSRGLDRLPDDSNVKVAIYMNRTIYSALKIQALNKSASALSIEDALTQFGGKRKELQFLGVPIRKCDALVDSETTVS